MNVPAEIDLVTASREQEIGVRLNRGLEWRSGEALALWELALALGIGATTAGPSPPRARRWQSPQRSRTSSRSSAPPPPWGCWPSICVTCSTARQELERSLALAQALGSTLWQRIISGSLAVTAIAQGDLARAGEVLAGTLGPDLPMATVMQRGCWSARAELALAEGHAAEALHMADARSRRRTTASATARAASHGWRNCAARRCWRCVARTRPGLRCRRRGRAPIATASGRSAGASMASWPDFALSQRRGADAAAALAEARRTVAELADDAPDEMRATFLAGAEAALPRPRPPTTLRLAKAAYGGLTAREREVAALIAQGRTNRQIAQRLAIGEATIATHVGHILTKLDLATRAEVAAWAVERGLRRSD